MNERIRELEERCWEELGEEECYYTVFNREKFAELLIRECIDEIVKGVPLAGLARDRVLKHFGVEE